jgi:hypothetical protein
MTKVMPGKAASAGPGPLANEAGYADVCNSPNSVAVSCVLTRGITVGSMTIVALIGLVIVAQFVIFCHMWPPLMSRLRQELDAQKNKQSL